MSELKTKTPRQAKFKSQRLLKRGEARERERELENMEERIPYFCSGGKQTSTGTERGCFRAQVGKVQTTGESML